MYMYASIRCRVDFYVFFLGVLTLLCFRLLYVLFLRQLFMMHLCLCVRVRVCVCVHVCVSFVLFSAIEYV